ncbi:MAG: hypothetical protein M1355_00465 [Patescibacteria group bacterium]|nr:hypothetical protein [Patescibacteria group bacterium]
MRKDLKKDIYRLDLGDFLIGKEKNDWKLKIQKRKRISTDNDSFYEKLWDEK